MIHNMERSYPRITSRSNGSTVNTTGTFSGRRMSGSHPSTAYEPGNATTAQHITIDSGGAPAASPEGAIVVSLELQCLQWGRMRIFTAR